MKRFILIMVSVMIAFGALAPHISAENDDYGSYQKDIELLTALGIISENIDISDMNIAARRADLADMAVGLRNIRTMSVSSSSFSDVTDTTRCANSINIAASMGIVSKPADGLFRPDGAVKTIDAYVVVLNVLGYAPIISQPAYPNGYYKAAVEAGIAQNIKSGQNDIITMEELVTLFVNALSAEVIYKSLNGREYASNGTTAMEEFIGAYTGTGKISAVYDEKTDSGYIKRSNKLYIDGVEYLFDKDTAIERYLGYEVKYYCKETDNDELNLLYITPTKRNSSIVIECQNIYGYENGVLKYGNGKEKKVKIEADFVNLNGVGELLGNQSFDFDGYDGGYVKLVDSDGNGKYDFVNIIKYNNYYVENVNKEKFLIYANKGKKLSFNIEDYSSETNILLCEKYRNIIDFDEIKSGDVLSIAKSADGSFITAYRSSRKIPGTVNSISSQDGMDNIKIADTSYCVTNSSVALKVGGEYTLFLDFMDNVAYADHMSNANEGFAYLINMYVDERGDIGFKMYTDEGEFLYAEAASKIKIGKEFSVKTITSSAENYEQIKNILSLTADVAGNGINQLIKYKRNADGKVTSVTLAQNDGSGGEFSLDYAPAAGYVRSGTYVDGRYRINYAETTVFCIPADITDYDKYSIAREMDSSVNYQGLKLFNIDEDTNVPEAAMFFIDSQTYKSTAVTYAALGVVADSYEIWDDNIGELVTRVDFMINGKSTIIDYKDGEFLKNVNGAKAADPKELNVGDVLQAYLGSDGKIAACRVVYTRDNKDNGTYKLGEATSVADDNTVLYGSVKYSDGEYMVLSEASGLETVAALSGARIYVYDSQGRNAEVRMGDSSDLFREQEVVIKKSATAYNQIVIFK